MQNLRDFLLIDMIVSPEFVMITALLSFEIPEELLNYPEILMLLKFRQGDFYYNVELPGEKAVVVVI